MADLLTNTDLEARNQLILDFLTAAKGVEVFYTDLAYFLKMEPYDTNCWMRKYGNERWKNGQNGLWWRLVS
ncbi:hypothetical protein [Gimesia fumaroli]|uniref:Uncharacterized protein n=1 Tax=Gimesia fumaroli TaxID=2527976 RepID=A0A518I5N4_9PLAN|nr:hypothetical protein [Gimesia fumaroli]QDV48406.1 hypothetical protein Enr17x_04180 [Gimesia fumaroli]